MPTIPFAILGATSFGGCLSYNTESSDKQGGSGAFVMIENNQIKEYIPTEESLFDMASVFAILSDPTRLKIISALSLANLTVTEITEMLSLNQTTVSHQLKTLKDNDYVVATRRGKNIYYSLKNENVNDILLSSVVFLGY